MLLFEFIATFHYHKNMLSWTSVLSKSFNEISITFFTIFFPKLSSLLVLLKIMFFKNFMYVNQTVFHPILLKIIQFFRKKMTDFKRYSGPQPEVKKSVIFISGNLNVKDKGWRTVFFTELKIHFSERSRIVTGLLVDSLKH